MDFGSLLHVAQKNEKMPKKEIKYYSTKFEPPKKEERSKQLSNNIKKFLARKEAEEKKKKLEAFERREELLALRSQDKKATRRVSVMLKRTKSANKSVIQDAIDNDNTAVTLAGPSQPDEDDYGYVSQEASAFYNKMMAKYSNMPEESKFSLEKKNTNTNLSGTKDRVRAALLKEQEDALLPHKRKRKPKEGDTQKEEYEEPSKSDKSQDKSSSKTEFKPKPKRPLPPPMDFSELLKIAEKKQFEPIKIEPKKVEKEDERPMTKKQKKEFEKEKAWRERKEKGLPNDSRNMPPPNKIPKLNNSQNNSNSSSAIRIPKVSSSDDRSKSTLKPQPSSMSYLKKNRDRCNNGPNPTSSIDRSKSDSKVSKLRSELEKGHNGINKPLAHSSRPQSAQNSQINSRNTERPQINRPMSKNTSNTQKNVNRDRDMNSKNMKSRPSMESSRPKQFPPSDVRPKQFPPSDVRPKQFPPSDVKPKQFPPSDVRPKQFPPPDVRRFPPKDVKRKPPMGHKRRILDDDSEDEYDSELDDFIDDGPEEGEDYSKYISEIFGYDKSKYRHIDEDDDNMESSFSQVMKEEVISTKLGIMEDLEDMKKEAEEKRRKAERMKKIRK